MGIYVLEIEFLSEEKRLWIVLYYLCFFFFGIDFEELILRMDVEYKLWYIFWSKICELVCYFVYFGFFFLDEVEKLDLFGKFKELW